MNHYYHSPYKSVRLTDTPYDNQTESSYASNHGGSLLFHEFMPYTPLNNYNHPSTRNSRQSKTTSSSNANQTGQRLTSSSRESNQFPDFNFNIAPINNNPNLNIKFSLEDEEKEPESIQAERPIDFKRNSYQRQNRYVPPHINANYHLQDSIDHGSNDTPQFGRQTFTSSFKSKAKSMFAKDNADFETAECELVQWDSEDEDRNDRLKIINHQLNEGQFYYYRYWMSLLYWFSIFSFFFNVIGVVFANYRLFYVAHVVFNVWEVQQYWYMKSAAKEKLFWAAERAVEMFKIYLLIGPLGYAVINGFLGGPEMYSVFVYILWFFLMFGVPFYFLVLKIGQELADTLGVRDSLEQAMIDLDYMA